MTSLSVEQQLEIDQEILECARYGDDDDLRDLLKAGGNVNFKDGGGNTALHKAAANNHVGCLTILKEYTALYIPNSSGNLPIHWAAQNKSLAALQFLFANYESVVDVLTPNKAGLSTLTEAFNSGDTTIISACLEHPTSSEEKLLSGLDKNAFTTKDTTTTDDDDGEYEESSHEDGKERQGNGKDDKPHGAVDHVFNFGGSAGGDASNTTVFLRELPISRADNPFGDENAPEDDTTGLGVWPASILMARYAVQMRALLEGRVVVELGCGCGLPGLAAAVYCNPKKMYLTDIHVPTLENLKFNAKKNNLQAVTSDTDGNEKSSSSVFNIDSPAGVGSAVVEVLNLNWKDTSTYPSEAVDVIIGADLVYDVAILQMLVPAIAAILTEGGTFLYCAPDDARDGMEQFVEALAAVNLTCVSQQPCPEEMFANPFDSQDNDQYVLHFYDLSAKVPHSLYQFVKS